MRASVAHGGPDHAIARIATRQYGLVTRAQLVAAGLDRGRIARRAAAGRLHRVLREGARLIVETDGWEAHGTRGAFQLDRAASNAFQLAGYAVLRFTHADLTRRPSRVAREIRTALAR